MSSRNGIPRTELFTSFSQRARPAASRSGLHRSSGGGLPGGEDRALRPHGSGRNGWISACPLSWRRGGKPDLRHRPQGPTFSRKLAFRGTTKLSPDPQQQAMAADIRAWLNRMLAAGDITARQLAKRAAGKPLDS